MELQEQGEPFITAYGEAPLVVLTEYGPGGQRVRATIVRPRELNHIAAGGSWNEAHWELFNQLLSDYMNLDRNRANLDKAHLARLFQLDTMRADGTLRLIAGIARAGFPPELHGDQLPAPTRIETGG